MLDQAKDDWRLIELLKPLKVGFHLGGLELRLLDDRRFGLPTPSTPRLPGQLQFQLHQGLKGGQVLRVVFVGQEPLNGLRPPLRPRGLKLLSDRLVNQSPACVLAGHAQSWGLIADHSGRRSMV